MRVVALCCWQLYFNIEDTTKSSFLLFPQSGSIETVSSFCFFHYKVDKMETFLHFGILNTVRMHI